MEEIVADPSGWTSSVNARQKVTTMLSRCTGLPRINVKLAEIGGSMYLFESNSKYYIWNSVNEEGALVTSPKTYDAIARQIGADIAKVQVQPIGSDLDED